jgi:hypothetical protein
MTTKNRAAARIQRAERIVSFLFEVMSPLIARVRESRRAA